MDYDHKTKYIKQVKARLDRTYGESTTYIDEDKLGYQWFSEHMEILLVDNPLLMAVFEMYLPYENEDYYIEQY
ncbi:hypothetical protein D3C75_1318790 [compost metagenome]